MGRRLSLVALAVVLVAGCGGDGEDATTADPTPSESAPTTVREATTEQVCDLLDPDWLIPADRSPEEGGRPREEVLTDLRRLVAIAPPELSADTAALLAYGEDPGSVSPEQEAELAAGAWRRVVAWGAEECDPPLPVWGCPEPEGTPTLDLDQDGAVDSPVTATPEELVPEGEGWVEVARTDDEATFARVEEGVALGAVGLVRDVDGWFRAIELACPDA